MRGHDWRMCGPSVCSMGRLAPRVPRPAPAPRRGGRLSVLHAAKDRELPGIGASRSDGAPSRKGMDGVEDLHLWSRIPDKKLML